jgi:signal peptide peptidase SppA
MKILDILNAPWMIDVDYHREMSQLYKSHMKGDKIDFKAFEAAFLEDSNQRIKRGNELNIQNGVAIIDITGPLTPSSSFFSFFFEGTSMAFISNQLRLADESQEVKEKLYSMRTPGGTVEGAFELAEQTFESAKVKPIRTFTDGMIASAGYLIASATNEILISGITNQIGSIGVISAKADFTEMDKKMGVEFTEYVSGKYKNIGSPDRKRDAFEDGAIQGTVDYLATLFFEKVSEYRGLDVGFIDELQAKLLIGQQAIEAGLVDGVSTFQESLNDDNKGVLRMEKLTLESFKAQNTELFNQIDSAAYERGVEAGMITGKTEGAEGERLRITGIESAAFPGQDELKSALIADGKTTAGEAAIQFNSAQKQVVADVGKQITADSPKPVEFLENQTPKPEEEEEVKDFMVLVGEYQAANSCGKTEALKAIIKSNPDSHKAYLKK